MSEKKGNAVRESRSTAWHKPLMACVALIVAGALAIVWIFSTEPTAERETAVRESAMLVDVTRPEAGTFRPMIRATGTVRPSRDVTLRPRVDGEVVEIAPDFVPGGDVSAGETLIRLDDDDYRTALAQRRSELEQALASLDIEIGRQEQAESELAQFGRELSAERRARVLREPQRRSAEAVVASARAALQRAELNLRRTTIDAPFDAQVLSRSVNLGSQVAAGDALGRLVGTETYWIELSVPVSQLPWLIVPTLDGEEGSPVTIRNRTAWPEGVTREGTVFRLVGELDGQTRMARLLVAVDDPLGRNGEPGEDRSLIIGEYVQAWIRGRPLEDVVRVDRDHVRAGDTVWLMEDGRLRIQPVEVAFQDERYAYVSEGLTADDRVVTSRLATVEDGVRLRVASEGDEAPQDSAP
ncbi:MAG: efflux RND transporter periplasmic adaptor subunit [Candidatus Wenzhouxiangella sp. M2_3B_020]